MVEEQGLELERERAEVARLKKRVSDMALHKKQWVADIQDVDKLKKEVRAACGLCWCIAVMLMIEASLLWQGGAFTEHSSFGFVAWKWPCCVTPSPWHCIPELPSSRTVSTAHCATECTLCCVARVGWQLHELRARERELQKQLRSSAATSHAVEIQALKQVGPRTLYTRQDCSVSSGSASRLPTEYRYLLPLRCTLCFQSLGGCEWRMSRGLNLVDPKFNVVQPHFSVLEALHLQPHPLVACRSLFRTRLARRR